MPSAPAAVSAGSPAVAASSSPAVPRGLLNLSCQMCESLVRHLRHDHVHKEVDMLKKIVEAWFYGTFDPASEHNTDALLIRPADLLEQDINPFLRSIGAPVWTPLTALFTEWFLKELNGFGDAEVRTQASLRLVRKASMQGYKDRLRALLAAEDLSDEGRTI